MEIDKKYALLDTDFLYKSHLARNANNHTLTDFVIEFSEYEFFCKDAKFDKQYLEGKYGADPYLKKIIDWGKINA